MKNIQVIHCQTWDIEFINRFINLQNKAQRKNPSSLLESILDYINYFHPQSSFSINHNWCLWILTINGVDCARLGTSVPKNNIKQKFLGIGYYESLPGLEKSELKLLFETAEKFAIQFNFNEVRLPMQGGFFGSYRARTELVSKPYYGEPQTLDRYLNEWKYFGYIQNKNWTNYDIDIKKTKVRSQAYIQTVYKTNKIPDLKFEPIGKIDLKKDLIRLLNLFNESYKNFDEFTTISPEDFVSIYSQYEFIFKNYFCRIVTYKNQDIGFCLAYPDILPALLWSQKLRLPDLFKKICLLFYLKFFKLRYYYPYQGLIPNAPRIKGFPFALFLELSESLPENIKTISGQYIADGNPILLMSDKTAWIAKNTFGIFKKDLN